MVAEKREEGEQDFLILKRALWRVRMTATASVLLDALIVVGLLFSALSAAATLPNGIASITTWLLLSIGVFSICWLAIWRTKDWRRQGGAVGALESAFPELRSDITTITQWQKGHRNNPYQFSEVLWTALERDLLARLAILPVRQKFSYAAFVRQHRNRMLILMGIIFLIGTTGQIGDTMERVARHKGPSVAPAGWLKDAPPFQIGNVTVQYRYPAYSGFEPSGPKPLGNSSIEALRGSGVELRVQVDREMKSVGAILPGGEFVAGRVSDGKDYEFSFVLRESGVLGFRGNDIEGKERQDPLLRKVQVVADEPPNARIVEPHGEQDAVFDGEANIRYAASDDFGLQKIALVLRGEGYERSLPLTQPSGRETEDNYKITFSKLALPRFLRVLTGTVEATDNDEVSGPKIGTSNVVTFRFADPEEARRNRIQSFERWMDSLLLVLADDLETLSEAPLAPSSAWEDLYRKGAASLRSLQELILVTRYPERRIQSTVDETRRVVARLIERRQDLILRLGKDPTVWNGFREMYPAKRNEEVAELERLVLFLDQFSTRERIDRMEQSGKNLRDTAEEWSKKLAEGAASQPEELEKALQDIQSALDDLTSAMRALAQRGTPEFVNRDALADSDISKLHSELESIHKLIQQGKLDEAKSKLREYLKKVRELSQKMAQGAEGTRKKVNTKLREQFESTRRELSELREREQKLADETRKLQEQAERRAAGAGQNPGPTLLKKAEELKRAVDQARKEIKREQTEPWRALTMKRVPKMSELSRRLLGELRSPDIPAARETAGALLAQLNELLQKGRSLRGIFERALPPGLGGGALHGFASLSIAEDRAREIVELLQQMEQAGESEVSQEDRKRMENLSEQQKKLRDQLAKWKKKWENLSAKIPIAGPQSLQGMESAGKSMRSAEEGLQNQEPGTALTHEREAIASLEGLETEMDQAKEEMQAGGSGAGSLALFPEPGGEGQSSMEPESILMPEPAREKETEEWRRALMDAMKEKPPEGYEDITRKYFRELVK